MIQTLVESAFKTRCLSVESEALIRQVLAVKGYRSDDLDALVHLFEAIETGSIQREGRDNIALTLDVPGPNCSSPFFNSSV